MKLTISSEFIVDMDASTITLTVLRQFVDWISLSGFLLMVCVFMSLAIHNMLRQYPRALRNAAQKTADIVAQFAVWSAFILACIYSLEFHYRRGITWFIVLIVSPLVLLIAGFLSILDCANPQTPEELRRNTSPDTLLMKTSKGDLDCSVATPGETLKSYEI